VTGPVTLKLRASSTAPDFDWTVRLTDVWPDGRSEWISDGSLRASLRKVDLDRSLKRDGKVVRAWHPFDTPQTVPLGEPVDYLIDVIATSNVFRAGHKLRVSLLPTGTTDTPRTGGLGAVTVDDAEITLPVIPRRCQKGTPLVETTEPVKCARSYEEAIR
jgi:predicted acyl esterase